MYFTFSFFTIKPLASKPNECITYYQILIHTHLYIRSDYFFFIRSIFINTSFLGVFIHLGTYLFVPDVTQYLYILNKWTYLLFLPIQCYKLDKISKLTIGQGPDQPVHFSTHTFFWCITKRQVNYVNNLKGVFCIKLLMPQLNH